MQRFCDTPSLLTEKAKLSPIYASECFSLIPEHILAEDRYTMFNLLLRKGAKGDPLNRGLIHAVRAGDVKSVELLVTPHFPGAQSVTNPNHRASTPGLVLVRHEIASVDYGEGLALQIAVHAGNVPIVKWLLAGKPSSETLDRVFPLVLAHTSAAKYEMVEAFLSAGLSHEAISATLHHAINQPSQSRDSQLIGMLLRHNADINFNDGAGILSAITIRDLGLLKSHPPHRMPMRRRPGSGSRHSTTNIATRRQSEAVDLSGSAHYPAQCMHSIDG
jgi:hypothetical protein